MQTVLAGDLGGTKCRFALVSEDFGVHAVQHVPTVRERGAFLAALDTALADILSRVPAGMAAPQACGFGAAGVIPADGRAIDRAKNSERSSNLSGNTRGRKINLIGSRRAEIKWAGRRCVDDALNRKRAAHSCCYAALRNRDSVRGSCSKRQRACGRAVNATKNHECAFDISDNCR
jgi:hypothetical protein